MKIYTSKNLTEMEQAVLLSILFLNDNAYGVSIQKEIEKRIGREPSIGTIHSVLVKLEENGLVESWMGDPTPERGGRRKRMYKVTPAGNESLTLSKQCLERLWRDYLVA